MALEIIEKRMEELSIEIQESVNMRNELNQKINELNVLIHQKIGAIEELNKILSNIKKETKGV